MACTFIFFFPQRKYVQYSNTASALKKANNSFSNFQE